MLGFNSCKLGGLDLYWGITRAVERRRAAREHSAERVGLRTRGHLGARARSLPLKPVACTYRNAPTSGPTAKR